MRSEEILEKIIYRYPGKTYGQSLSDLCSQLHDQQYRSWEFMRKNYDALHRVRTRRIICDGFDVTVQYNPARMKSTNAETDELSIASRPCFLCQQNLPGEQKGILYRESTLILCNPFPIFPYHFTVGSILHVQQNLESHLEILFDIAKDLDSLYTIFYNGAKCGASAPDHFHFQACPSGILPIELLTAIANRRKILGEYSHTSIKLIRNIGRTCLLLEGKEKDGFIKCVQTIIDSLKKISGKDEEPMVNILLLRLDGLWRMFIFPRTLHRPSMFFVNGEAKMIISPASVDMSGLIITPREEDFIKLKKEDIKEIYREVSMPEEVITKIISRLNDVTDK